MLKINDVKISYVKNPVNEIKAYCNITIENAIIIKGIRIKEIKKGENMIANIELPYRKTKEGRHIDTIYFLDGELYRNVKKEIINTYETKKYESD